MISYTGRYIFGPKKIGLIVHFEYFDVFLAKMSGKNCYSNIFLNTNNLFLVVMFYLIG